jgi:hypothetical protein
VREDSAHTVVDLGLWRFRDSCFRLLQPSELPIVPVVRSFLTSALTRHICDRVSIQIAASLPSLQEAIWRMNDWEIRYITLRRAHRHDLAQAITEFLPRSSALRSLTLHMSSGQFWAPNFSIGALDPSNSCHVYIPLIPIEY